MKKSHQRLNHLFERSEELRVSPKNKILIISDLHMGDGSKRDDFNKNSHLTETILSNYYYKKNYHLILNGDIEELFKFSMHSIENRYRALYNIFMRFNSKNRLTKLVGNHDYKLLLHSNLPFKHQEALRLHYGDYNFFVYHGHQSSYAYNYLSNIMEFFIGYFAKPFNIKNYSVAYNKTKSYGVERDSYSYAQYRRTPSIIGHSHRPLFESHSKRDTLLFKLEKYLRAYRTASSKEKEELEKKIPLLSKKISSEDKEKDPEKPLASLYSTGFVQPYLFNSGCFIGKKGITCLEIKGNKMALVQWFDGSKFSDKVNKKKSHRPEGMEQWDYYRRNLKEDSLEYIFNCIKLL